MKQKKSKGITLSAILTFLVLGIVLMALACALAVFFSVYRRSMEQNAVISSEQAVVQVSNTVSNYTKDMESVMRLIEDSYHQEDTIRQSSLEALLRIRSDVVAVFCYDEAGILLDSWTGLNEKKQNPLKNLSYPEGYVAGTNKIYISEPHVESLLVNYYPWVVSMMQEVETESGNRNLIVMDILFSHIASYVDEVGIGQHGYCFIMDQFGNIIYHPQQQLIYSGLKEEKTDMLVSMDGSVTDQGIIYSMKTLENSNWRVVGVSYVDELITAKTKQVAAVIAVILLLVLFTVFLSSFILSKMVSTPIERLVAAMRDFEKDASGFVFRPVTGSSEIGALSDSFGHLVTQIQELMEKVRSEEISLRKTELRALQAQINPHFLYNTLDAIGWMCEEERYQDAVDMVNSLAKLFRISISKGHELITIKKEVEHAKSYLKIQNFRYKNQFIYEFNVDEDCLSYQCNKITLQPIIENAIYHGLNRMVDEGKIEIGIRSVGEDVVFTVTDNGVGMSQEQCESILKKELSDQTGIGIKNVNDRIKIYFGEQYGIQIRSEPDQGTCVTICMPKIREGSYEAK